MFPPLLPQLLLSIAEPVLNKIVRLDPDASARLQKLQGKQLAVELTDIRLRLVMTVQPNGIWLDQHQEKVDCALITSLASLRQLKDPSQLTRLIRENALDIDGDLQQLQQFNQFFARLEPAWTEHLSGYIGDAAAHKVSLLLQQALQLLKTKLAETEQILTELAQDELQLSPHPAQLQQFSAEVSQLSARTEQLARQLALIKGK